MTSVPAPGSGRLSMVMAVSWVFLSPVTAKSSREKEMMVPISPFLEKSLTAALSFLFQKKAEAGRDRVKARARARMGAMTRRNG
ncbi:Uncharacterised protein [uncultured Clostridium sp.]|nr:Uncharacterised protein [uncultured Clostridium sp.]